MYRVLHGKRKHLITSDEVIAVTAISGNVDARQIEAAIQIAEERFIRNAICSDLFDAFREEKNVVVTSINLDFLEDAINESNNYDATDPDGIEPIVIQEGDIVNAIENVSSSAYKDLWYEHLWKLIAEAVIYIASPTNFSRFEANGEMNNSPRLIAAEAQGATSVDLPSMKWKMDKMIQDRIDPLIAGMKGWLSENRSSYPLYNCVALSDIRDITNNGVSLLRKTAWVHGIYAREPRGCYNCGNRDQL